MRVDAHCHAAADWYEPAEALLFQMDRNGVDKAVLTQVLGGFDNRDMAAAVKAHPDRFRFVAALAPDDLAPRDSLRAAIDAGATGLRLRANARAQGDDPFAIWSMAAEHNLAISLAGTAESFLDGALEAVAQRFPALPLVLEHLGGLARPDCGDVEKTAPRIAALASHGNVFLKIPGLGQLAPRAPNIYAQSPPLDLTKARAVIGAMLAAFGSSRLMWGSDYPPVSSREGYANALRWTEEVLKELGADADAVLGGVAAKIFSL